MGFGDYFIMAIGVSLGILCTAAIAFLLLLLFAAIIDTFRKDN